MSLVPASEPNVRLADLSPEYSEIMVLGKVLQASGYFKDVKDQAQAVTKILFGRELGISPINSMSAIHIIEGKPALSSNLMAALIKRSGRYDYRVKTWDDAQCVLIFRQKVDGKWEDLGESSFTIEDAKRAGVIRDGGGWKKYPKAMLFARALSQGERTYCPDVSVCTLYVPEELGAEVNEQNEVIGEIPNRVNDVPRTTKPIPIPRNPAIVAAQDSAGKGRPEKVAEQPQEGPVAAAAAPPQRDRQPGEDDEEDGNFHKPLIDAIEKITGGSNPPETFLDAPIDLARQRALHRAFKDALRVEMTDTAAGNLFRDWLKHQGYIGPDGKGSTKVVPTYLFDEVRANAVKFAEGVK